MAKLNPFAFVDSVSFSKEDLLKRDDVREEDYQPFLVNRSLSYHPDTVLYANDMNVFYNLPKVAQYTYLLNTLRPRKRFAKWVKPEESDLVEAVQELYNCNVREAADVLSLLNEEQKQLIKQLTDKGGKV